MLNGSGFGATITAVWDRDYDLSVDLTTKYGAGWNDYTAPIDVNTVALHTIISGVPVDATGVYSMWFEGDFNSTTGGGFVSNYYFIKNGVNTNISQNGANDKRYITNDTPMKLGINAVSVSLTSGDTVGVVMNTTATTTASATVDGASVIIIKVS
jgi:hypothetical protein